MEVYILAVIALVLAAALWYAQVSAEPKQPPPLEEDASRRLRRTLAANPRMVETMSEAIRAQEAVMAHPELGGPGFLLVQFPSQAAVMVTAQYPNIRGALYRRIVCQELERDELAEAGMPEELLSQAPIFETESGGVVLISIQSGELLPELAESLNSWKERNAALEILREMLAERFPELSVRIFGTDLTLTPVQAAEEKIIVTSKNE